MVAADPGLARDAAAEGIPALVSDAGIRELLEWLAARAEAGESPTLDGLLDDETVPAVVRRRVSAALAGGLPPAARAREGYAEAALALRIRDREREAARLARAIREAEEAGDRGAAIASLGSLGEARNEIERLKRKRIDLAR
jgi:chorismate mutase